MPPGGRVRLQRLMAQAGVASRRECERLIEQGQVEVNGAVVSSLPAFVDPRSDRVRVRGRALEIAPGSADRVYVMLNKPEKTIASTRDQGATPGGAAGVDVRKTVVDLVKHKSAARLYPVGRLGFHDTGLVLLTNDGDLAHRLTHASFGVPKTYEVMVKGSVPAAAIQALRRKLGGRSGPVVDTESEDQGPVRVVRVGDSSTVLRVVVSEGVPLEDIFLAQGCHVRRITRIAIGPLHLRGVSPGTWRDLTRAEVQELKQAAGLRGGKRPSHVRASPGKPHRRRGGP